MSTSAEYVLLASVFYQRQQDGTRKRFRRGETVTGLSENSAHRLLKIRAIAPASEVANVASEPVEPVSGVESVTPAPGDDATKPDLIAWVLANLVKDDGSEYSEAELRRMNKDDLWALINAVEDDDDPDADSEE
ncbi:hypothetical protein HZU38_05360 [Mycolicibacterium vanbaalenii]|uniref:hypothetical protein n=1 Tax=Mycolicibacterium vanbaalenii TaxID=110539 RepID=UPI001F26C858|nr:hypothetical protein [Mycolicibacterium vanbaalenii]UJL29929.1 hypothetical protein HZU38_05360 [Mycolicibacterium vanbaalenii]WND57009.1 hypothetical protein QQA43_00905 [Mycolicibacterium vanbaalenii]